MSRRLLRVAGIWIAATLATDCGGGGDAGTATRPPSTPQYVAVVADGVFGHGLVLRNNGSDDLSVPSTGNYNFAKQLTDGATYDVTVYAEPSDPAEHCTVTGRGGTVTSGVAINVFVNCVLIVSGTYIGVDYGNSGDGASLGVTALDDAGGYTSTYDENDAGAISTGIVDTGTYSVDVSGIISMNSMMVASSSDGEATIATDLNPGESAYLNFDVKKGSVGFGDADLSGSYVTVTYEHSGTTASLLTVKADGAGNYDGSASLNDAGAISSGVAVTGSYAVAADGALSLDPTGGAPLRGGLSESGELLVLSQLTAGQAPSITVGVKLGSGPYSAAVASGCYVIVTMEKGADSAVWHELTFDGAGHVSGGVTRNDSGVITDLNQQNTYLTEQGTYGVATDGTLTLTLGNAGTLTGAISADGEFLILIDLNAGQMPRFGVGLRSFIAFDPWGY